jgi:hypothetical protein
MDTIPETIHALWTISFIDDEISDIPQRSSQSYYCKFIRTNDRQFYESRLTFDPEDPYYQKNNACEFGLASVFTLRKYVASRSHDFTFISVRDIPPSKLEEHRNENTFETVAYLPTNEFNISKIKLCYTFTTIKHNRILTGYYIKIPTEDIRHHIISFRERIKQFSDGL